jgi:hypothetical protein
MEIPAVKRTTSTMDEEKFEQSRLVIVVAEAGHIICGIIRGFCCAST